MKKKQTILAGALSLALLAGCQGAAPAPMTPTTEQPAPVAAVPAQPVEPASEPVTPAAPAELDNLSGSVAIFGEGFGDAELTVEPLGAVSTGGSNFKLLAVLGAKGKTRGDGSFNVNLEHMPTGTPLKVTAVKNGQVLTTAVLSGATTPVKVNQATTLAFLATRLDRLARGLRRKDGQLANAAATAALLRAFSEMAESTETSLKNDDKGRDVVKEATRADYVIKGLEMTTSLSRAFAAAAPEVANRFNKVSSDLNTALTLALASGGLSVPTTLSLGSVTVSVSQTSGGGSSGGTAAPTPTPTPNQNVGTSGSFELPQQNIGP